MASDNLAFTAYIFHDTLYHLVGYRMGKQDDHVSVSDAVAHGCARLAEYFCLTSEVSAQFTITPFHAFISAYDHNTHDNLQNHAIELEPTSPDTKLCP